MSLLIHVRGGNVISTNNNFVMPETQASYDVKIIGSNEDDTISSLASNDVLQAGSGNDLYIWDYGSGSDVIREFKNGGTDVLRINASLSDAKIVREGADIVIYIRNPGDFPGSEKVSAVGRIVLFSQMIEGVGVEQVQFSDVTLDRDAIYREVLNVSGTEADELLVGSGYSGAKDDFIFGAGGNDTLRGGAGDDIYLWTSPYRNVPGSGNDLIVEHGNGGDDKLVLSGVLKASVSARVLGMDVILSVKNGDGSVNEIRLRSQLRGEGAGIETIEFADGAWIADELSKVARTRLGTSGADSLAGSSASAAVSDTLEGGAGDDTIRGGSGDDLYVYSRGDGNDLILERADMGFDSLRFTDLESSSVAAVYSSGSSLKLVLIDGSVITLAGQALAGAPIDEILFADGSRWDANTLASMAQPARIGSSRSERLNGSTSPGLANEVFIGRSGDDTLAGGVGDDRYLWSRGDGSDTIIESAGKGSDTLVLTGVQSGDVSAMVSGSDLLITIADRAAGDGGAIRLSGQNAGGIEKVIFADGIVWSLEGLRRVFDGTGEGESIAGSALDDDIYGHQGADTLTGGDGANRFYWNLGDGDDVISGTSSDELVLSGDDLWFRHYRVGDDFVLRIVPEDEYQEASITFKNYFILPDGGPRYSYNGKTFEYQEIVNSILHVKGTDNSDLLRGANGNDVFYSSKGDDTLLGGAGDDFYNVDSAMSDNDLLHDTEGMDSLKFWLGGSVTSAKRVGRDLVLSGENVTTTLSQYFNGAIIEKIMSGGDTIDYAWISSQIGEGVIVGDMNGNELFSKAGKDWLLGQKGSDYYVFDSKSTGADTIVDTGGDGDRIFLTEVSNDEASLSRDGNSVRLHFSNSSVIIQDQLLGSDTGIEKVVFEDGVTWSWNGGDLAEIYGTVNDDIISSRTGDLEANDFMRGGAGSDIFRFRRNHGDDIVADFVVSGDEMDRLSFDRGLFTSWEAVQRVMFQYGNDTGIWSAGGLIVLRNVDMNSLTADNVIFR